MKKITIMVSLMFVFFVLSGCGGKDSKDGKKECDKKGAGWVWNVTEEKCEEAVTTKEDCEAKGAGWVWDETDKKCNQSTVGLSDKEKCEAKGAGWAWNKDKATGAGEEYKKCTKDLSADCADPAKPVVKNASPLECVASYYTVINSTGRSVTYQGSGTGKVYFQCVSISEEEFNGYSSFGLETTARDGTEFFKQRTVTICESGANAGMNTPCPSEAGIYEVSAGRTGFVVTKVDKTVEELKEMDCFRYMIEAEGPL